MKIVYFYKTVYQCACVLFLRKNDRYSLYTAQSLDVCDKAHLRKYCSCSSQHIQIFILQQINNIAQITTKNN